MSVSREIVSQTIIEVARQEDLILRRVGKGIFRVRTASCVSLIARTWFSMSIIPRSDTETDSKTHDYLFLPAPGV
jgi:hypothetical protein